MTSRGEWLAGLLVVGSLLRGAAGAEAWVDRTEGRPRILGRGDHEGMVRREHAFRFHLGQRRYTIRHLAFQEQGADAQAPLVDPLVGMPRPCSCNWYHSGFLFFRLDGRQVDGPIAYRSLVVEKGERAMADIVWDAEPARVRFRFAGRPGDDRLLCHVAWELKGQGKDVRLLLRCYPSFFTAWHDRAGDRRILTPGGTLEQGQNVERPAHQSWYAVYYDTVFDVARGEGEGPCALLFDARAVRSVRFRVGSYGVDTELVCPAGAGGVRLALWEFPGVANARVLAAFRSEADRWAEALRDFDFTPSTLRRLDPGAELARLERLTQAPAVRRRLGARAGAFAERFRELAGLDLAKLSIARESRLLEMLPAYRDFLWELRLAALLAE